MSFVKDCPICNAPYTCSHPEREQARKQRAKEREEAESTKHCEDCESLSCDCDNPPEAVRLLGAGIDAMRERAQSRGEEEERSMERVVKAFNGATGHRLSTKDGWAFMVCLKLGRAYSGSSENEDDYIDGSSYFALMGEEALEQDLTKEP